MYFRTIKNKIYLSGISTILLLLLFNISTVNSQVVNACSGCPSLALPCIGGEGGGVRLFLDIRSFGDGDQCTNCCEQPSCRRFMYEVRLGIKATNLPNNFSGNCFSLDYERLILEAGLAVAPGSLTNLNKKLTEMCAGPGLAGFTNGTDFTLEADESTDITKLTLGDGQSNPPICMTRETLAPGLFRYVSGVLFTMAADFYPGEDNMGQGATQVNITYTSGATDETCYGISGMQGNGTPPYNYPSLTADLLLSLDPPTCTSEISRFPVSIKTSADTPVDFLDFEINVLTDVTLLTGYPNFINFAWVGALPTITYADLPNNTGYNIHVVYENVIIPAGLTPLFEMEVEPQTFTSGTNVLSTLVAGRAVTPDGCFANAIGEMKQQCVTPPTGNCNGPLVNVHPREYSQNGCAVSSASIAPAYTISGTIDWRIDFTLDPGMSLGTPTFQGVPVTGITATVSGNSVLITGTNITWTDNTFLDVPFVGTTGCIQEAEVRKAILTTNSGTCALPSFVSNFPSCPAGLSGEIRTYGGCFVDDVTVNKKPLTDPTDCVQGLLPALTDCEAYHTCLCPSVQTWIIKPEKNDDIYEQGPLTAADLQAISDHILGLVPLGNPYRMIAADANNSGSITTYDIVELRKLILGIYSSGGDPWPAYNAPSWRFIEKNFVLDQINPFLVPFPETKQVSLPSPVADFVAVKIGSLLDAPPHPGTIPAAVCSPLGCNPYLRPEREEEFSIKMDLKPVKEGELVTVPVYALNNAKLTSWQMGIQFDASQLEFISATPGDLSNMTADNWGITAADQGKLKVLWLAQLDNPNDIVHQGDILFYLTFKSKYKIAQTDHLLQLSNDVLTNAGWLSDYTRYEIKQTTSKSATSRNDSDLTPSFNVGCQPNPTAADFAMEITVEQPVKAELTFFDALGRNILHQTVSLETGTQKIRITDSVMWPDGIYHWNIKDDAGHFMNGQIVKQ